MRKLWSVTDICEYLGYKPTTVYTRIICQPDFPKPVRLGPGTHPRWFPEDVETWTRRQHKASRSVASMEIQAYSEDSNIARLIKRARIETNIRGNRMKAMTIILATCALLMANSLWASCVTSQIGNQSFTTCSDGSSYTAQQIGDQTFYSGAVSGTTQTIGNQQFHQLQNPYGTSISGTTNRIGNTSYSNFHDSNGNSYYGNSSRIGNLEFHNGTTPQNYSDWFND